VSLRAGALLELRWGAGSPRAADRAIALLELARRRASDDPAVLNDLSVAYLEEAQTTQRLEPMLHALDLVERAVTRDSLASPVLYNRALVMERLYLLESARDAWSRYRAVERDPGWRAEADVHLRRLSAALEQGAKRGTLSTGGAASPALVAEFVKTAPQQARDTALQLLGEWGKALSRDQPDSAERVLGRVRMIADGFEAMDGDRSVGLALRAVEQAIRRRPERVPTLAQGHAALADGVALHSQARYEDAAARLARAERALREAGSPAARWAAFFHAFALMELGRYADADAVRTRILARATPAEPALIGKTVWALGVSDVRQGFYDEASARYRAARPYVARAKEPENMGAISYLLAESLSLAGQWPTGYTESYRGLRALSPFRRSNFLNNHLSTVAAFARTDGLSYAATAVMGEVLKVAGGMGKRDVLAWALRARARDWMALGDTVRAREDLSRALRVAGAIKRGKGRDRVLTDVLLVSAELERSRNPRLAARTLSGVVATYERLGLGVHLPRALYEAAEAEAAAGNPETARLRLETAVLRIEGQQFAMRTPESRATHLETVEDVFDAMIGVELAGGRWDSALEYLERGRVAAWPPRGRTFAADRRVSPGGLTTLPARLPAGVLFADYAVLRSQLVIWTASKRGWRHYTVALPRDSLTRLMERFAQERTSVSAAGARTLLFDLLLRPFAGDLAGVHELVLIPDRELHQLPFAALLDRNTGRYLIERVRIRTLPSAAFLRAAPAGAMPGARQSSALVVGEPAIDTAATISLRPLPGAREEATAVAGLYGPTATLLIREQARRGRVVELLTHAFVFHFAGHAVFNSDQPELSYLALSPDSAGDDGLLRAREIGELRLSNIGVVVLSACSTLNPRPSRAGPTAGLAYSFLRAGVPATVSTLWDVDDATTTEVLVEFHRRLAGGVPAAEALRLAQVAALRSPRPELRAPQAWAAFVYTGP
jgi:CHAT domain-containing protein